MVRRGTRHLSPPKTGRAKRQIAFIFFDLGAVQCAHSIHGLFQREVQGFPGGGMVVNQTTDSLLTVSETATFSNVDICPRAPLSVA